MTQWIRCSERLPDEKHLHLISDGGYRAVSYHIGGSWYMSNYMWNQPTHWQPLPEPPDV